MFLHGNKEFTDEAPIANLVRNAVQLGKSKDRKLISWLVNKKRIYSEYPISSGVKKAKFQSTLFIMMDIFQQKFGDDWDLQYTWDSCSEQFTLSFIIIYPEIKITNSRDSYHHTIKDLLVVFDVEYGSNGTFLKNPKGTRLTLSHTEVTHGYRHSHLPTESRKDPDSNVLYVRDFCMGSGDLSLLLMELALEFEPLKFELLLYTLDTMLSWESLEGNPYIQFNKLKVLTSAKTMNEDSVKDIYEYGRDLIDRFFNHKEVLNIDFYFAENRYRIQPNQKFISWFLAHTSYWSQEIWNHTACIKIGDDYYSYKKRQVLTAPVTYTVNKKGSEEYPYLFYNGQKKFYRIAHIEKPLQVPQDRLEDYTLHPNFLKYVIHLFEQRIQQEAIRQSGIAKYHSSNIASGYSTSDQVSL